jgi:hypothetical protein
MSLLCNLTNKGMPMPNDASGQDLNWLVSSTCESGACVAVARMGDSVLIRRINAEGPIVEFTTAEWLHFLAGAKQGDFDNIAERRGR